MKEELLENLVVGSDSNLVCNMMEQKYNLEDKALFAWNPFLGCVEITECIERAVIQILFRS